MSQQEESKETSASECKDKTNTSGHTTSADKHAEQDSDRAGSMDLKLTQDEDKEQDWQNLLHFKGLLIRVLFDLPKKDVDALAFMYSRKTGTIQNGVDLANQLVDQKCLCNNVESLKILAENLGNIKKTDFKNEVDAFVQNLLKDSSAAIVQTPPPTIASLVPQRVSPSTSPPHSPPRWPNPPIPLSTTSCASIFQDHISLFVAPKAAYAPVKVGNKRPRLETAEEKDLEVAAAAMEIVPCDTTSDNSDEMEDTTYEPTPDDRKFMAEAKKASKNSKDEETKVGSAVVNSKGEMVGIGWNRMPVDCEDMFQWVRDREKEAFEEGKHLYVVYAIRAAIFDAYKKRADLTGATLYTTLFPSNICAQCIREAGIRKVVYCSNKFHTTKFMKASRRLLKGIECRLYNDKN